MTNFYPLAAILDSLSCTENMSTSKTGSLLNRDIEIDFIDNQFETPEFRFQSCVEKMLQKNVNPFVACISGKIQYSIYKENFVGISPDLLLPFVDGNAIMANGGKYNTELYYSILDGSCGQFYCSIKGKSMTYFGPTWNSIHTIFA